MTERYRAVRWRFLQGLVVLLLLGGCRTGTNYVDPSGPRFAGGVDAPAATAEWPDTLLVVSFNIRESRAVDRALEVFESEADLARPDVVLLQEMDEEGTARIAAALGLNWVYYPAVVRKATGRRFGNAILSRWPIVDDEKLILPRVSVFGRMQRIATAATVDVGGVPVRVYSVHLSTPANLALLARNDQFRAILDDAASHPRVIIGGDMNSGAMPRHAERRGFHWATEEGPRTAAFGRWDHIVYRGLAPTEVDASGTILDRREASDHRPVWVRAVLR